MAEQRYVIPICKKHERFQSGNGRWLSIVHDLTKHIEFTKSYDAILTEGECDKCVTNPNQIVIVFEDVSLQVKYNSVLASGMFWEFHPELTGIWDKDKKSFAKYHK